MFIFTSPITFSNVSKMEVAAVDNPGDAVQRKHIERKLNSFLQELTQHRRQSSIYRKFYKHFTDEDLRHLCGPPLPWNKRRCSKLNSTNFALFLCSKSKYIPSYMFFPSFKMIRNYFKTVLKINSFYFFIFISQIKYFFIFFIIYQNDFFKKINFNIYT